MGHTQHQLDFQRDCRLNLAMQLASAYRITPHKYPGPQGSGEFPGLAASVLGEVHAPAPGEDD